MTADPYLPVPPDTYGGIERVIDMLVRELTSRGHEIVLWAHPASRTAARLRPYGRPPHRGPAQRMGELMDVAGGLWRARADVDLVHSFGRLAALLPVLPVKALPKIQSYQRAIPWKGVRRAARLAGRSLRFTACSTSLYANAPGAHGGQCWHTVFNGVDAGKYAPAVGVPDDAPLVFLGRLERIKGVHHAVAIARGAGRRLVIAGTRVEDSAGIEYFDREIAPALGIDVEYIGPVTDRDKNDLLGRAAALLMPIEWDEPFGIVMAEAFACGTPVIGFARGSVAEVVTDGVTGFVVRTVDEAIAAVPRLRTIDRRAVRAECERRFSAPVIADGYERLYRTMIDAAA
jgi:glycosyltransferase involved in cell wall biosynthesis